MKKMAIFLTHPIQYLVPLFKTLDNKNFLFKVFYYNKFGVKKFYDNEFEHHIKWDIPLLSNYKYAFLKNFSPKPSTLFFGSVNLGIFFIIFSKKYSHSLIFGWNSLSNILVYLFSLIGRKKIVLLAETPIEHELIKRKKKLYLIRYYFLRFFFMGVSQFLYIGKSNYDFYRYYGISSNKLTYTPYSVDNERHINEFNINQNINRDKLLKNPQNNSITILFVGKLIKKKRPFDLLKAYHNIKLKYYGKKVSLIYVGNGNELLDLKNYCNKNKLEDVNFIGFVNQNELKKYYLLADLFVLPSGINETWGLVVNEAMCYNLPIITSNLVGCSRDLVHDNINGYVFKFGNINNLEDCIEKLIVDNKKLIQFGKNSKKIILNYSFEIFANNLINKL